LSTVWGSERRTDLNGCHDPEGVLDLSHFLGFLEGLSQKTGVIDEENSRRFEETSGTRGVIIDERGTVLVQQERFSNHRTDERPHSVAKMQRLQTLQVIL